MFSHAIRVLEDAIIEARFVPTKPAGSMRDLRHAIAVLKAAGEIKGPGFRYLDSAIREEIARLEGRGFSENAISLSAWKKLYALIEALPEVKP